MRDTHLPCWRMACLALIFLLLYTVTPASSATDTVNVPPEAYFIVSPSSGQAPLTVNFDASGSIDFDGTIALYSWNFGDGGTALGEKVSHTYKRAETFSPTLTVTDNQGLSRSYTSKIAVAPGRGLYVTIVADPALIGADETSVVKVNVAGRDGSPISGARVNLTSASGGKLDPESGVTDSTGLFTSTFTAGSVGNYKISSIVKKDVFFPASVETVIKVIVERPLFVTVASKPTSIGSGESSTIKVTVTGDDGAPVQGAGVMLSSIPGGTVSPASGQTNPDGEFTSTYAASADGEATVKVSVRKQGFVDGSGQVNISVVSESYSGILIAAVLVMMVASGLYFMTEGKLQVVPLQSSVPCDGKSTIPVKIQFVDPSGRPKKQKRECRVEMRTTSGTIQNVVIPAGKEFAEAVLTSSNECGHVTITAKSGIQKAKARVDFQGTEAGLSLEIAPTVIPADGISISSIVIKVKDNNGNYITSLGERTVYLTTTLGTITSHVVIPPRTLSGVAIITSGNTSGTANVTATTGSLRGEGKIVFAELAERYCMHCGASMKRDVTSCPDCKKKPPVDADIKQCSTCSAILPSSAMFCDKCGSRQPV